MERRHLHRPLKKDTTILMIRTNMRNCEHSVGAPWAHPLTDAWNEISASLCQTPPLKRPKKISTFVPNYGILWDRHLTAQWHALLALPSSLMITITTRILLPPVLLLPFPLPRRPSSTKTHASQPERKQKAFST